MISERYEIRKKLGEGAMGSTWLVFDRKLEMEWAMKCWKITEPEMKREMEIQTLKVLYSQYFPRIVEAFRENGRQYLIMDRIRGISLDERLRKNGKMKLEAAADIMLQLCDAVQTLHEHIPPVYHLDLKPSNMILTEDGIKLIDFGSALYGEPELSARTGTPGFSAPEQMNGEAVDERSDIYGLGAVFYTMLCGKGPEKDLKENKKQMRKLSKEIRGIIEHTMHEKREERLANVPELRRALFLAMEQHAGGVIRKRMIILPGIVLTAVSAGTVYGINAEHITEWKQLLAAGLMMLICFIWFRANGKTDRKRASCYVLKECFLIDRRAFLFYDRSKSDSGKL